MSESFKVYTVKKPGITSLAWELNNGVDVPRFDPVPVGQSVLPAGYSAFPEADIQVIVRIYENGMTQNEMWKIPGFDSKTPQQIVDEYFTVSTVTRDPKGSGWITDNPNQPLPSWLPTVENGYRFGFLPIGFNWSWLGKMKTWLLIIGGLIVIDVFREKK